MALVILVSKEKNTKENKLERSNQKIMEKNHFGMSCFAAFLSCLENSRDGGAWWATVHGVAQSRTRLSGFTFTVHSHALEKAMATHSSALAWRIPRTEEPGGLPSMRLQRVGHDWATSLSLFTLMHWRRQWQPTPVLLPGESQGREPGGLPSMRSHRVGHGCSDAAAASQRSCQRTEPIPALEFWKWANRGSQLLLLEGSRLPEPVCSILIILFSEK